MAGIWKTWDGRRLVLVRYVDHYIKYFYPNPDDPIASVHKRLRATFPEDDVSITSATQDDRLVVAHLSGDREPGRFIVVDTRAMRATHSLAARRWLDPKDLAEMTPIQLKVRDGTPIDGYLSLPPTGPQKNLPLVVLVHGGPAVQDVWGFDPEVQILATHGYAVLQVNFRGSSGFGRDFEAASAQRWGLEMQDDVTDATRWAIAEGIADPARVCIYGGSYGAYAALTGVYREPNQYRCAIGYAGVYDLTLFDTRGDVPRRWFGRTFVAKEIGTDEADLRARSPVNHADEIKAAVLLIHGGLDQRAPLEHAKRMRAALKRAGNEPEWLYEADEGHGFFGEKNRLAVYERILDFLDRHIGSRAPALPRFAG
jgi:dipeptidyl aminopeptidase/acylaminoacyl peptidase